MNLALDLDGTLISCEPRQSAVLQAALVPCEAQVDVCAVWGLKRNGASTEGALRHLGLEPSLARGVAEQWQRMIEEPLWLQIDSVLRGVSETLCQMRSAAGTLWLLTARNRAEWVPQQLARLGLAPLLDEVAVVSAQDASCAKAAVLRDASAVAFFGDTESDWHASSAASVPFYAVASGQRSLDCLAAAGVGPVHADLAAAWRSFVSADACASDG